ncbi:hypothetical protein [Nucisporomicrobium flavum]|uniref:hypothetical protein n=1 Tax=Nucisporomicrobium flavum TaxID=2785915 RepID=UPI0018F43BD5|nr:hypothetical protein [Nucisporomicrobium flavum]
MTTTLRTITTATTLDHVTVWRQLAIPGRRPIDIRERASAGSTVTYRFTGPRAAGALTITPAYANDLEAIPTRIRLRLGIHGPTTDYRSETRNELPTINTVTLHGEIPALDPGEYLTRTRPGLHFARTGQREVSARTNDYFCQILTAIIGSYLARPQTKHEQHATAIRHAAARLHNLNHRHIQPARTTLDQMLDQLAALDAAATHLRHLADENV